MQKTCATCETAKPFILRPKNRKPICKNCFFEAFENEIHFTITSNKLFSKGDRVVIGASGGKDSTVLIHIMHLLNQKFNYGLDLQLLSIDEGIIGYRDDSLLTVHRNQAFYNLPLTILSYKDLYNWTMDEIVSKTGLTNNCTFCGVFRRQALDRGAQILKAKKIITGHNADDIAETVLMNILRGDFFRLGKSVEIKTGEEEGDEDGMIRCKPFKYTYEKEIVLYAYHKKLDYFSTECKYSPNAYRGYVRELIKDLEVIRPSTVIDIIHSGEKIGINAVQAKMPQKRKCTRCGFIASNALCKACVLLESLGKPKIKLELEEK